MKRHLVLAVVVAASACIISRGVQVEPLARPATDDGIAVVTPVKAHLIDGSTILFPAGVRVERDTVWGVGTRYDLALHETGRVAVLPLDSVVGMESYRTVIDGGKTVLYSVLLQTAVGLTSIAIACAADPKCFGSCPTYYSDSAGTLVLEAEGFSYSIAALFEARDVDRLRFPPDANGVVRLEVRNEAFETHYINHLELLEVRHSADEVALPDERNNPFVLAQVAPVTRAVDRAGRDVRRRLAAADGDVYRTDEHVLARARGQGDSLEDWIDLTVAAPPGADSVAVVLRLRNSLLNTILFYDIMLGDPGARSLDWVGRDLQQVGPAVELGQWYQRRMGMGIAVQDRGSWRLVTRLKDTGPVAWKDVAIAIPTLGRASVRVRLSFPADNWRIDRVAVAARFRRLPDGPLVHPLAVVRDAAERVDTAALASMTAPDQRYLETTAGQRFAAEFHTDPHPAPAGRTFFLASQGYYTEWVRNGWLAAPRADRTFRPSDAALAEAIARWRVTQDTLEARFMATRVPVR